MMGNWRTFFNDHAPDYMGNVFVKNTEFEIKFIIKELGLKTGQKILDVGCGTGRHSVPLAKKEFRVTGIDLSEGMLKQASDYAEKEKVIIDFIRADATNFSLNEIFDHAICICEGSFGLLAAGDDPLTRDLSILKNINACLQPGGKLLLTVLNGLKKIREHGQDDIKNGVFDPIHLITREVMITSDGSKIEVLEKGFTPIELILQFQSAGFRVLELWGGTAGSWNKDSLDPDEYEIMVIAEKLSGN